MSTHTNACTYKHIICTTTTTDPRCHPTSLQAVARDEAAQVSLLPEAVYLCTEATAATLKQTHSSGMQVRSLTIEQYVQEMVLANCCVVWFVMCFNLHYHSCPDMHVH